MTDKMKSRLTDIDVELRHETASAVLVSVDGEKSVWLPLSQIEVEPNGLLHTITLPEWLALEKGLI